MSHTSSIERLRVYVVSRKLEDSVYELAKKLPPSEFFRLGNDLRRSSAALSHYLAEYHRLYGHAIKLEALHRARAEAQHLQQLLQAHADRGFGATTRLQNHAIGITKQCWGLIRYLRQHTNKQRVSHSIRAVDELVAARQ